MQQIVDSVTAAVDFAPVVAGIGTVAGAVALVYVGMKGAKMIMAALR